MVLTTNRKSCSKRSQRRRASSPSPRLRRSGRSRTAPRPFVRIVWTSSTEGVSYDGTYTDGGLSPGDTATGILSTGNLALATGARYLAQLNGDAVGTDLPP